MTQQHSVPRELADREPYSPSHMFNQSKHGSIANSMVAKLSARKRNSQDMRSS